MIKLGSGIGNKTRILFLLPMFFCYFSFGQLWEHYYPMNFYDIYGSSIIQTYDGGYVMSTWNSGGQRSRINKLDMDGNIIWSKAIFCATGYELILDICESADGGLIVVGTSSCNDPSGASFIMRLNSCGELLWLKEFGTFNDYDRIDRVIPLRDGTYLAAANSLGVGTIELVGLIKFDNSGNLIWYGDYTHDYSPALSDVFEASDSSIYITGRIYVADPGFVNPVKVRTHLIKVDPNGMEQWEVPLGLNDLILTRGNSTIELPDGNLLTLTEYNHPINNLKQWSYLIKTDTSGQEVWKKFVSDTSDLSDRAIDLLKLSDTTAIILCNVSYSYNASTSEDYRLKAYKIDLDGTLIDSAQFGSGGNTYGMRAKMNDEGDVVVCGMRRFGNQRGPFAIKLRSYDLQIDTLMNISLTYDSLCPFPMVSDTIFYDTTSVNIHEVHIIERKIKLFPNPTSGDVTVEYTLNGIKSGLLEIYDMPGKLIRTIEMNPRDTQILFSMADHPPGIYTIKVIGDGRFIDAKKLCVFSR